MRYAGRINLVTLALLATTVSGPTMAANPEDYHDGYGSGNFGRIRYQENGASLLRASTSSDEQDPDEAVFANAVVFPGDRVRTDSRQRIEIQLARGTLVRIDRSTEVVFLALPDPYASPSDNTVLQLVSGAIQVAAKIDSREEFRIDTPTASVFLLGNGDFRIDAPQRAVSRVSSRRGVAEVVGEGGSVLVRGGMNTIAESGTVPADPQPFNTLSIDGFDSWVAQRDDPYRRDDRYDSAPDVQVREDLPYEVRPYYRELSAHGRWVQLPTFGYAWYPLDRDAGWRPYRDGYWAYGPGGYFWVSSEPWGWAPYRYGRWTWAASYGWCWIPGRVFAGAWVAWSWGSSHVGWCPLDYWNRPVFHGSLFYAYYDPDCWTFVHYRHLGQRGYRGHAVPAQDIGDGLRSAAVVTRPPRIAPSALSRDDGVRARAWREARENPRTRVAPISERRGDPGRSFVVTEQETLRIGVRARTVSPVNSGDEQIRSGSLRRTRATLTARPSAPGAMNRIAGGSARQYQPEGPNSPGRPARERPRASQEGQSALPGGSSSQRPPAPRQFPTRADRPAGQDSARSAPGVSELPDPSASVLPSSRTRGISVPGPSGSLTAPRVGETENRVRDMYRRLASPRVTRKPDPAGPSQGGGPGAARPSGRGAVDGRKAGPRVVEPVAPSSPAVAPPAPRIHPPSPPPRDRRGNSTSSGRGDRKGEKKR